MFGIEIHWTTLTVHRKERISLGLFDGEPVALPIALQLNWAQPLQGGCAERERERETNTSVSEPWPCLGRPKTLWLTGRMKPVGPVGSRSVSLRRMEPLGKDMDSKNHRLDLTSGFLASFPFFFFFFFFFFLFLFFFVFFFFSGCILQQLLLDSTLCHAKIREFSKEIKLKFVWGKNDNQR